MAKQPAYVELGFVPSDVAHERFEGLGEREELIVLSDAGDIYRGARAWIMCLWALVEYRELAMRLSNPVLLPFARAAFQLVSSNRKRISRWLGIAGADEIAEALRDAGSFECASCPVCFERIATEIAVVCERCDTPHHYTCWNYVGKCAVFGCGQTKATSSGTSAPR